MKDFVKIGWAEEDLTPSCPISLTGQFYERISQGVESPITVTAMAVEAGEEQMVICSCDLTSISFDMMARVRELLQGEVDFPLEKLIVGATHTHASHSHYASPTYGGGLSVLSRYLKEGMVYKPAVDLSGVMDPKEALEFISVRIAAAVKKAWNGRKKAIYAAGFGRAAVGMNRRVCYNDGSAKMWGDADNATFTHLEGGNDSGIELLYTFDENKKLTGVVANIACPSQVMEHRNWISSDYWGKVKDNLRAHFSEDLFVLGLCSAAGDQCPRDLVRWVQPDTPIKDPNVERLHPRERRADPSMFDVQGIKKIGKRIAHEIIDVYDELEEFCDTCELEHRTITLNMPVRRVTPADKDAADRALREFVRDNEGKTVDYMATAMMHVHAGTIQRFEYQYDHDLFPIEVHCIRMGDMAFCTNPFELFLDYGNQIRARSLAKQTFIIQLSCGVAGYLPTETAEKGGHYSAYVSSGVTGHEGGDILVRETLRHINEFFAN